MNGLLAACSKRSQPLRNWWLFFCVIQTGTM